MGRVKEASRREYETRLDVFLMTNQQIRLLCGELNASEMRLARALCGYYERAIVAVLEANRGLADGDDCTLSELKKLVPNWK